MKNLATDGTWNKHGSIPCSISAYQWPMSGFRVIRVIRGFLPSTQHCDRFLCRSYPRSIYFLSHFYPLSISFLSHFYIVFRNAFALTHAVFPRDIANREAKK
jgi:hypothetical protein